MENKGFADNQTNIETPNDIGITEKPLNPNKISSGRVDINVLKARAKAVQDKENTKNTINITPAIIKISLALCALIKWGRRQERSPLLNYTLIVFGARLRH